MKKFTVFLCAIALVFGISTSAFSLILTDVEELPAGTYDFTEGISESDKIYLLQERENYPLPEIFWLDVKFFVTNPSSPFVPAPYGETWPIEDDDYEAKVGPGATDKFGGFNSYFLHFDPKFDAEDPDKKTYIQGEIDFENEIIMGIIFSDGYLDSTDSILGLPINYYPSYGPPIAGRGFDRGEVWTDEVTVYERSLTLNLRASSYVDQARVITRAIPVPEPATMLLVGAGLIGLAGLGRKKFLKRV